MRDTRERETTWRPSRICSANSYSVYAVLATFELSAHPRITWEESLEEFSESACLIDISLGD